MTPNNQTINTGGIKGEMLCENCKEGLVYSLKDFQYWCMNKKCSDYNVKYSFSGERAD